MPLPPLPPSTRCAATCARSAADSGGTNAGCAHALDRPARSVGRLQRQALTDALAVWSDRVLGSGDGGQAGGYAGGRGCKAEGWHRLSSVCEISGGTFGDFSVENAFSRDRTSESWCFEYLIAQSRQVKQRDTRQIDAMASLRWGHCRCLAHKSRNTPEVCGKGGERVGTHSSFQHETNPALNRSRASGWYTTATLQHARSAGDGDSRRSSTENRRILNDRK